MQDDLGPPPTMLNAVTVTATLEPVGIDEDGIEYENKHSLLRQALAAVTLELSSFTDTEYFITFWLTPDVILGRSCIRRTLI